MGAQENFRVDVRNEGRAVVFAVEGELDLATSPTLEQELERVRDADIDLLIVDLRELQFMDSTGLHALVKAHKRPHEAGRRLAVITGVGADRAAARSHGRRASCCRRPVARGAAAAG